MCVWLFFGDWIAQILKLSFDPLLGSSLKPPESVRISELLAGGAGWVDSCLMRFPTRVLKMAIEIVDFSIKNGGYFHSFLLNYQRVGRMIIEIRGIQPGYSMRGNVLTWLVRIQAGWWRLLHVTLVRKSWKSERNWAVFKSLVDWCLYGGILPTYFGLSLSLSITLHAVKSYEPTRRNGRRRLLKHCSSGVVFCPKLRVMFPPPEGVPTCSNYEVVRTNGNDL